MASSRVSPSTELRVNFVTKQSLALIVLRLPRPDKSGLAMTGGCHKIQSYTPKVVIQNVLDSDESLLFNGVRIGRNSSKVLKLTDLYVMPAKAGIQERIDTVDSRSPRTRGQVYPCESRGGNDKLRYAFVKARLTAMLASKPVSLSKVHIAAYAKWKPRTR